LNPGRLQLAADVSRLSQDRKSARLVPYKYGFQGDKPPNNGDNPRKSCCVSRVLRVVLGKSSVIVSRQSGLLTAAVAVCVTLAPLRAHAQWWSARTPVDFEDCADLAEKAATKEARTSEIAACNAKFAGRRKSGGGYTYYDFMQNRSFDIAGPNPTKEEQKHIDEQYTSYLGTLRREAIAATTAEQKAQADSQNDRYSMGPISPPGPPKVITPTNVPIPRPAPSSRAKNQGCEEASLSCSWTKFSAGIKNIFGSYAKANRP
jgi:hypothetical protein